MKYEDRFEYQLYTTKKKGPDAFSYLLLALALAFLIGGAIVAVGVA